MIDAPIGTRQHEQLDRGATWLDDELQVSFLRGPVVFTRFNDRIQVEATLETATTVQCVRSLEMFELPLTATIEELAYRLPGLYVPEDDVLDKLPPDLWVNLREAIREAVLIAIPMNPVHPDYRDAKALDKIVDGSADWLTVKWADQDDANSI
jgi:uncharacterized metal-binding protein YceD (DUF177 family)